MAFSSNEGKELFKDWVYSFSPRKILDVGPGAGVYADLIHEVEGKRVKVAARKAVEGSGSWSEVTKCFESPVSITGLEVFKPYINQFGLKQKYDRLIIGDIYDLRDQLEDYDLIIFGDVLDHLPREKALQVWSAVRKKTKFLWLSTIVRPAPDLEWYAGYTQEEEEYAINPYEKQVYCWSFDEILKKLGPFLWRCPFKTVVCFVAEGDRQ